MKTSHLISLVALTAVASVLTVPVASALNGPETDRATAITDGAAGPRVVAGRVVDAAGQPLAHASVIAHTLSDHSDGTSAGRPLAHTITNAHGEFVLAGQLAHAATRNSDGSITVQLRVVTDDLRTKLFGLDLAPPAPRTTTWSWGGVADTDLLPAGTSERAAEARQGVPVEDLVLNMRHSHLTPSTVMHARAAMASGQLDTNLTAVETAAASTCVLDYNTWLYWSPTKEYQSRMTPIQKIDTKDRLTVDYTWKDTESTKHQVAFAGTGKNYAGGLEYSQEQVYEAGTSPNFGNNWHGNFRIEERYRKWKQYCVSNPGGAIETGETKWRPYKWIGGTDRQADFNMFYCAESPITIESEIWVARRSTRRWNGYFDLAGVQLDTSQENSGEHRLSFIPDARPGWGRLCGNTGDVFVSTMVREVE